MTIRRVSLAILVGVSYLVFVSVPAHASGPKTGTVVGPNRAQVVVIGDSLLHSFTDELSPKLSAANYVATMKGADGTGLTATDGGEWWDVNLAAYEAALHPATVVIELGTNDANAVAGGLDYRPVIQHLLDQTNAPRVLWATCGTHTASVSQNMACATIDEDLRQVRRPGFGIIEMDEVVYTNPDNICCDSVHLSAQGQQLAADLFTQSIGPK